MNEKKSPEELSKIRSDAGRRGGQSKSQKKADAARENGKLGASGGSLGGRPLIPEKEMTGVQKKRRERYVQNKSRQKIKH